MAQVFHKITSQEEWDEITIRVREQFDAKYVALQKRVEIALMACVFGGVDSSLPKLEVSDACEISEMFATGEYLKCDFLLKEHNL